MLFFRLNKRSEKIMQTADSNSLLRVFSPGLPDGEGAFTPCPTLLTEHELVRLLRIPEISHAADYHNVIENLKRARGFPRVRLCGKVLYPLPAIMRWIDENTVYGQ